MILFYVSTLVISLCKLTIEWGDNRGRSTTKILSLIYFTNTEMMIGTFFANLEFDSC